MDKAQFFTGLEEMELAERFLPQYMRLHWYDSIESTNITALKDGGLASGTVIAADRQLAGRGRLGRTWHSPPGQNLYFSIIFYPKLSREFWGGFSLAAAVALAEMLTLLDIRAGIKWPNDLHIGGNKLAGILLEAKNDRLVLGIGINVNQVDFPLDLTAASLRKATGKNWRRDRLLALFAHEVLKVCEKWDRGEAEDILAAWRQYDTVIGRELSVLRGKDTIQGVAVDVDPTGALIVEGPDGFRHLLHSGEITLKKN
jgi:BirA family biotin operon repressor/biotin-[acetyl-CoA-carboxylase] ligase